MADRWARKYNFVNGTLADAEQVDEELDQLIAALNLLDQGNFSAPFLLQQKSGLKTTGTATAVAQGKNSQDWVFQGSGWDGAAAQVRELTWRLVVTDANTYRLALLDNALAELLAIDQAGLVTLKRSGQQLLLKPSVDPAANTKLLEVQNAAGASKFSVDIEGDILGTTLTLTGALAAGSASLTGTLTANLAAGNPWAILQAGGTSYAREFLAATSFDRVLEVHTGTAWVEALRLLRASGNVRLPNNRKLLFRNAADTGDIEALFVDTADRLTVKSGGTLFLKAGTGGMAQLQGPGSAKIAVGSVIDFFDDTGATRGRLQDRNWAFGSTGSFGGGDGVVFLANAATVPSSNPAGGGIQYVENGALKYRGSSGTVTTIAPA